MMLGSFLRGIRKPWPRIPISTRGPRSSKTFQVYATRKARKRSKAARRHFGYLSFNGIRSLVTLIGRIYRRSTNIFQDVYEWAGKLRTVEIAKPGSPFFAFERYLVPSLDKLAAQIKAQDQLRGLTVDEFAVRAGHYLGELNAVHPFREGNGRAQQEFIRELGLEAGHTIEWQNVSRELMYAASKVSFERADPSGLAAVISIAIVSSDRERAAFIRQAIGAMREAKTTMLPSAIGEQETRVGSIVRGKIVAVDDRHVAIATGPRSFAVLERVKLTEAVTVGDHVTARIGAREIVIEQRAQRQSRERSR